MVSADSLATSAGTATHSNCGAEPGSQADVFCRVAAGFSRIRPWARGALRTVPSAAAQQVAGLLAQIPDGVARGQIVDHGRPEGRLPDLQPGEILCPQLL